MATDQLTALEIAECQLLAALKMWEVEDYVCAITLAGAAEEILGKRLRKIGIEPSFDNIKEAIVLLAEDADSSFEKEVGQLLNQTRNELKHYAGDETLDFDLRRDAEEILERAVTNYQMLTGHALAEMIEFWGSVNET